MLIHAPAHFVLLMSNCPSLLLHVFNTAMFPLFSQFSCILYQVMKQVTHPFFQQMKSKVKTNHDFSYVSPCLSVDFVQTLWGS